MATQEEREVVEGKDTDESSSGETEEEIEPKLRYERLANDLPQILEKDVASCIAIHTKFLALGTHWGVVYVLDHHGNNIRNKELALHTATVNEISIDMKGEYIGTCSDDGKVVIHGLYNSDCNQILMLDCPVRSIALDPLFYKSGSGRRFLTGERKVLLHEKGMFSRYKTTNLYQGEGIVQIIRWKGQFAAWANDQEVRVFDIAAMQTIAVMKREHDPKLRSELYRCNLFWKDDNTLLIGWADNVKQCVIRQRAEIGNTSVQSLPHHLVEIISVFNVDCYICGIAPLQETDGENNIVVLTVPKDNESTNSHSKPQLRVLEPHGEDSTEISNDTLTIRGYTEYRCSDYRLDCLAAEGIYIIVSPKDVVMAKPRDENDHVAWLLDNEKFEQALAVVMENKNLERYTLLGVGKICLNHLLELHQYDQAAALCPTILGNDKQLWEEEVYKFVHIQQSRAIAPYLPIDEKNCLDPAIYEVVLNEFLQHDSKGFLELVRKWPPSLYNIPSIVNAVIYRLVYQTDVELLQSLCDLYTYEKKYDKALEIYLKIGNKDRVFDLIRDHNLFTTIHDKLEQLMELNCDEATQMLLESTDKIPIDLVVSKLKQKKYFLYKYLDRLFSKDRELGEEHHGMLVELYAEYASDRLLSFLRSSNSYPLEDALRVCQQRSLIPEVIFLLGRMGNTKQALQQITEQLHDIAQAIDFCKDHDDKELWEDLINYSLDKPEFIRGLLQNIGTHVDPIMLIQRIPTGLEIQGLRDSLVTILQDYYLQISLREGCQKILVSDCYSLLERLNKQQRRGIQINDDQVCQACHRKLIVKDIRHAEDILVFHCKHAFHEGCLPSGGMDTCSICSAQKQRPVSRLHMN